MVLLSNLLDENASIGHFYNLNFLNENSVQETEQLQVKGTNCALIQILILYKLLTNISILN